jgi:hypothetical protein
MEHIMEFVNTKKIMGRANAKYGTEWRLHVQHSCSLAGLRQQNNLAHHLFSYIVCEKKKKSTKVETQESKKELRTSLETPRVGQGEPTLTLVGTYLHLCEWGHLVV